MGHDILGGILGGIVLIIAGLSVLSLNSSIPLIVNFGWILLLGGIGTFGFTIFSLVRSRFT